MRATASESGPCNRMEPAAANTRLVMVGIGTMVTVLWREGGRPGQGMGPERSGRAGRAPWSSIVVTLVTMIVMRKDTTDRP